MKNYISKATLALLVALSATGCSDFLDEKLKSELAPDKAYKKTGQIIEPYHLSCLFSFGKFLPFSQFFNTPPCLRNFAGVHPFAAIKRLIK